MNHRLYKRLVEISKALKPKVQSGQKAHFSYLIRKQRVMCIGWNNYNKIHPAHRFGEYKNSHKFTKDDYRASLHSEISLTCRAGLEDWSGYDLVNIRIDNNDAPAMSACCSNCARVVASLNPNNVFYSVDEETFAKQDI